MLISKDTLIPDDLFADDDLPLPLNPDKNPLFMQALNELLEIQQGRKTDPIMVMPQGPRISH